MRGDYVVSGGRLVRSLVWTVARGYLPAPLCDVFVDLFDEIGDF